MIKAISIATKKVIARVATFLCGWKVEGTVPKSLDKLVMIGAPHTSNWDFVMMVCCAWYYGLEVKWLGKEALFKPPIFRSLARFMGGIKVERHSSNRAVETIANQIQSAKHRLCLVIAPEGTRSKKPGWRSGFYYIAKTAKIPIGCGFADYKRKIMGVGPILSNLSDLESNMKIMRDFYKNVSGKHPENESPVQLI